MSTTQLPQPSVGCSVPPRAEIAALVDLNQLPEALRDCSPLPLAKSDRPMHGQVVVSARPAARLAPWRLPATVGPFLAQALHGRWQLYREQLRRCQEDFSEETVHELRVATRRLIALFVMVGCVTRDPTAEKARRLLKRRLKALGELRDTHVQRLFIERHTARFPELILVRGFLRRRERRLERGVAGEVNRFKTRRLEKWISAVSQDLASGPRKGQRRDRLAIAVARATASAFAEVVQRRQKIDPATPSTIHRTRLAFKKFRYMVESLSPDCTGLGRRQLRALAQYQRRMGLLQDLEVMQRCITTFVQKHKKLELVLRPFSRYLQASRARALRLFLRSADDLIAFWPPTSMRSNGSFDSVLHAA